LFTKTVKPPPPVSDSEPGKANLISRKRLRKAALLLRQRKNPAVP
jgi:hypothetical protein